MDADETYGEKAWRELHKNATSYIEQILEATSHETAAVWPLAYHLQIKRTIHSGHCWRSKDELISDVLLWTPSYVCASVGRPRRAYLQQLCTDTDLPRAMDDRDE